jgi:hypothetical protein
MLLDGAWNGSTMEYVAVSTAAITDEQTSACACCERPVYEGEGVLAGVIEDVYADTGVEYLRLRGDPTVRLDWIRALNGRPFP